MKSGIEMPYFSVIVPVYNRRDEVEDLLRSLTRQTDKDFEIILVEDGSTERCEDIALRYSRELDLRYFYKTNEGRSIARNYGLEHATGQYFVFFDSDCVIPPDYFKTLGDELAREYVPCFGGPRGGKVQMEKFVPRSFNMGYSREVYEKVGGFREMFSEDIDMSTRVRQAGFDIRLIRPAFVYHKRRTSISKFARQTYVFGMSRITLKLLYPDSLKAVHCLPAVFLIGCIMLLLLSLWKWWFILPILLYAVMLWCAALIETRNLKIATLAVATSFTQLCSYGWGFVKAYVWKILLKHGRDINEEINMRKGK